MGIKGLSKLLAEHSPGCSMERKFQSYLDRKIAIDASMHIYQYLVSTNFFEFSKSLFRIGKALLDMHPFFIEPHHCEHI